MCACVCKGVFVSVAYQCVLGCTVKQQVSQRVTTTFGGYLEGITEGADKKNSSQSGEVQQVQSSKWLSC